MLTLGKQGLGSLRKTQNWKDLCDEFFKGVPALGEVQAPSVMSPMASTRGWCHQTHTTVSFSATGTNTCVSERRQRFAQQTGRAVKHRIAFSIMANGLSLPLLSRDNGKDRHSALYLRGRTSSVVLPFNPSSSPSTMPTREAVTMSWNASDAGPPCTQMSDFPAFYNRTTSVCKERAENAGLFWKDVGFPQIWDSL